MFISYDLAVLVKSKISLCIKKKSMQKIFSNHSTVNFTLRLKTRDCMHDSYRIMFLKHDMHQI